MRWRPRAWLTTTAAVAGLAALAALGAGAGAPVSRPRLLSGAAWLASTRIGQATLLDGSTAEVAGAVPVADPGDPFDLVQQDAGAYAVNHHTGTIRRVDGATFAVTAPATPIPAAGDGLRAFTGAGGLVALDTGKGAVTAADPRTLAPRGDPVSLTGPVETDGAVLDGAGRLWVLDAATGDLVWIDRASRTTRRTRPGAASPGTAQLVLAGGDPVIVDPARRAAVLVDRYTGAAVGTVTLDVRADDRPRVAGSGHGHRIYLAARGVVDICDLAARRCTDELTLGSATATDLGTPVESGSRLFVPDYATGSVWIVDLVTPRVVAHPRVLAPPTRFELLARDGLVFFNDADSERAGVIQLDGGVRHVAKYDPEVPGNGPPVAAGPGAGRAAATTDPGTRTAAPGSTATPSGRTGPTPTPTPSATPSTPPAPTPPGPGIQLTLSVPTARVGDPVTIGLQATSGTEQPANVLLSFGDGQTAGRVPAVHSFAAAQTYQITAQATLGGNPVSTSVSFVVTAVPLQTGTVRVSFSGSGTVASQPGGISCPSSCTAAFPVNSTLTLTATPAAGFVFAGWGGGTCFGTGTCQVTVTAAGAQINVTFQPAPDTTGPTVKVQPHNAIMDLVGPDGPSGNVCGTDPTSIDLRVTATDPSGIRSVSLHFDAVGTSRTIPMTNAGGSTYDATIGPFTLTTSNQTGGKVSAMVTATDTFGNPTPVAVTDIAVADCSGRIH